MPRIYVTKRIGGGHIGKQLENDHRQGVDELFINVEWQTK